MGWGALGGVLIADDVLDAHRINAAEDPGGVLGIRPAGFQDHLNADALQRTFEPF